MGALTSTATRRSPGVRMAWRREGIEQSAVHQYAAFGADGAEHHGDGDGGPDGVEQAARGELHFLFVQDVRSQGGVGQGEILNRDFGDNPFQFTNEAVAFYQPVTAQGEVGQLEHLALVPAAQPFLAFVHLSGCVHGSDHRSHGAAGDGRYFVTTFQQGFYHADVGDATGAAHGEYEGYLLFVHKASIYLGFSEGGGQAVRSVRRRVAPAACPYRVRLSSGGRRNICNRGPRSRVRRGGIGGSGVSRVSCARSPWWPTRCR